LVLIVLVVNDPLSVKPVSSEPLEVNARTSVEPDPA